MGQNRGLQLFQHPGPTNIPDRVLRAMDRPVIDYTGAAFQSILTECQAALGRLFKTKQTVITYTASGHGAWEAALVNVTSPGDTILVVQSGFFSEKWSGFASGMGLTIETLKTDWRQGADPAALEERLREDRDHDIAAVMVVHNETSVGIANQCGKLREAIDRAGHPALYLIDAISSLGCFDVDMDAWQADVIVAGSQKGLMLPVGLSFTGVSAKALEAMESATMPRSYWDWRRLLTGTRQSSFHGTQPVTLVFGLHESLRMLEEEGLENCFARHNRVAEGTRQAVGMWEKNGGPEILAADPKTRSDSVTAVLMPEGLDADVVRSIASEHFSVALAPGLAGLKGRIFRIGHMGDVNEVMIIATLAACEMSFDIAGVPYGKGGVGAAMSYFSSVAADGEQMLQDIDGQRSGLVEQPQQRTEGMIS